MYPFNKRWNKMGKNICYKLLCGGGGVAEGDKGRDECGRFVEKTIQSQSTCYLKVHKLR